MYVFLFYFQNVQNQTATKYVTAAMLVFLHCKKFRRIYGRIAGNQLPGYIPLFFMGTRKNYLA